MQLNQRLLSHVVDNLKDLNWCFFSGFAVKLYADQNRDCDDLDLLVQRDDLEEFASRLGTSARSRSFVKDDSEINDRGFETKLEGIRLEVSSGFPSHRVKWGTINKVFNNRVQKQFLNQTVYLVPLEELVVHKAEMFRDKDKQDLQTLRKKIESSDSEQFRPDFLKELARDWNKQEQVVKNLQKIGFDLE